MSKNKAMIVNVEKDQFMQILLGECKYQNEDNINLINSILEANNENGRIDRYSEGDDQKIVEYINKVVDIYNRLHTYINAIQVDRNDDDWAILFEKLTNWANRFFIRKGFAAYQVINNSAFGLATEASMAILTARFPYDVEFDPWAYVILENCCLNYMRYNLKRSVIPAQNIINIDDAFSESFCDSSSEIEPFQIDLYTELYRAIDNLTPVRKEVIQSRYFKDMSPEMIADKLKKSTPAIYSLQFNALQDLRKNLQENGIC